MAVSWEFNSNSSFVKFRHGLKNSDVYLFFQAIDRKGIPKKLLGVN